MKPILINSHILQTETSLTAVIHLTIAKHEIQTVMGPGIMELNSVLAAQSIKPTGAWFTHHFRMFAEGWDFEIGMPIAQMVKPAQRVLPSELTARRVARTTYRGPYEGLGEAWSEFRSWIAKEGHQISGDLWECYERGPESGANSSTYETQLNQPLL